VRGDGEVQWEFRKLGLQRNRSPDLKVEWGDGNKFRLTSYSAPLRCVGRQRGDAARRLGLDHGQGEGVLNGRPASATFKFTDFGEPGREDRGTITILNEDDVPVLRVNEQELTGGGNHQAHRR
jgi:hypothetical protein